MLSSSPYVLYSDGKGNIFEDVSLYAVGRTGWDAVPVPEDEWIELPGGGQLYELPGRKGIGIDVRTGDMRLCDKGWAVAAFIPPAHTGFYVAAYEALPDAPTLPLFCYTAVGWYNEKFYVPAVRIEQDIRQECAGFNDGDVHSGVKKLLNAYPHNRLVSHLANNCALLITVLLHGIFLLADGNVLFLPPLPAMQIAMVVFLFNPKKKPLYPHKTG
jgi:hypothetical protein